MLTVGLGLQYEFDQMDVWFQRAMKINPSSYDACRAELYYLEPKWGGSIPALLAFGRQCVESTEWKGRVPLIMLDAHEAVVSYLPQGPMRTNYWKNPLVWRDIKDGFEKFFQLNPEAIGWRHNYALYANRCEAWSDLGKQIAIMEKAGPVNYDYFGGRVAYEAMKLNAKEKGGKENPKPETKDAGATH